MMSDVSGGRSLLICIQFPFPLGTRDGEVTPLPATTDTTEETENSSVLLMSTTSNEVCVVDDDDET